MQVKFAEDLAADIKVWVAPDADSKAAIDAARKARDDRARPGEQLRTQAASNGPSLERRMDE